MAVAGGTPTAKTPHKAAHPTADRRIAARLLPVIRVSYSVANARPAGSFLRLGFHRMFDHGRSPGTGGMLAAVLLLFRQVVAPVRGVLFQADFEFVPPGHGASSWRGAR